MVATTVRLKKEEVVALCCKLEMITAISIGIAVYVPSPDEALKSLLAAKIKNHLVWTLAFFRILQ